MYLLLVVFGGVIFIHSVLFVFIIQKNTDLTNKIDQFERQNTPLKSNIQKPISPKKRKKSNRSPNEGKIKSTKRGSRER